MERQTTLAEFGIELTIICIPIRNFPYKTRRGLAEGQLRKRLERQGWKVWRGGFLYAHREQIVFPAVKEKYRFLAELLRTYYPSHLIDELEYICLVHHGMPDFLCYHPQRGFKFVECKLGHEGLSEQQIKTIQRLQQLGFLVEIHKLVAPCTKVRTLTVNVVTKKKRVHEREMKLVAYARTIK